MWISCWIPGIPMTFSLYFHAGLQCDGYIKLQDIPLRSVCVELLPLTCISLRVNHVIVSQSSLYCTYKSGDSEIKRNPWLWTSFIWWNSPDNNGKVCGCSSVRFVFHVLRLLPIWFAQQNLCCISKSKMKHQQESIWKLDLSWLGMVIGRACLLIPYLNT